jgi:hypothetical protein
MVRVVEGKDVQASGEDAGVLWYNDRLELRFGTYSGC